MPFALDASVTLAWALPEESQAAKQAWMRIASDNAMVPALWWFELRNGLVVNERRARITEAQTARFLRRLSRFPIAIDDAPNEAAVMSLERRHRLTVYDASYLELALREAVPLARSTACSPMLPEPRECRSSATRTGVTPKNIWLAGGGRRWPRSIARGRAGLPR